MKRKDSDWLEDMLEAIDEVDTALDGKTISDVDDNSILRAAVSHFIMIISEASRSIPTA